MAKSAKDVADIVNRADKPPVEPHFEPVERNAKGQFQPGHSGAPGWHRPKGSRNKLAEDLVADVHAVWQESGISALRMLVAVDPGKFCALAAQLVPRDVKIDHDITITRALDGVAAYRLLQELPRKQLEDLRNGDAAVD
jgi:hypothetical protein